MIFSAFEAVAYLIWARLTLRERALSEIRRQWGEASESLPNQQKSSDLELAMALGKVTMQTARRLPFSSSCLAQSLALTAMLRRRGIQADLRIGVRQGMARITAHAWVEYENRVVLDTATHDNCVPFDNS